MTIENVISRAVSLAVKDLYGAEADPASVNPAPTKKEFEGDMTVVVFPYLKVSRRKPEDTARGIGEWLVANEPAVKSFNVVKGFLNLTVNPAWWLGMLHDIAADPEFGMRHVTEDSDTLCVP